jgi:hypothetical protein
MDFSSGLIKREFGIWIQYFLISFVAATVAYIFDAAQQVRSVYEPASGVDAQSVDIQSIGMVRNPLSGYYKWWLFTFIGLSIFRMLILLVAWRLKNAKNS